MTAAAPERVSHSRIAQYGRCGWARKLKRVDGVKETPSIAMLGGSGWHAWTEDYDRDGGENPGPFEDYFEDALIEAEVISGMTRDRFKVSGRKTKDRPNGEDIAYWRDHLGPELCARYEKWEWPDGWSIAVDLPPDSNGSNRGIEYHVELTDPLWQGYIDRVFVDRYGNYYPVDLKTWQRRRTSAQLQEYGNALRIIGVRVNQGAYYDARKGTLDMVSVRWGKDTFREYVQLNQMGMEAGLYLPVVDEHCGWCGVRENCEFAP